MRLKSKQTGEIRTLNGDYKDGKIHLTGESDLLGKLCYGSLKELCEEWEDAPEEKKYGGRVPKEGDKYWVVFANGVIESQPWEDKETDGDLFECGSAFWTKEEAKKELKRRKAYVILKEDTNGFKPDWKVELAVKYKYAIYYNYNGGSLHVDEYACFQNLPNDLIFANKEDAEASIKVHEKEWKTWLGVENE